MGRLVSRFVREEVVLVVSTVLMLVSMVFVPPSAEYLEYINLDTLIVLFCMMVAVAGLAGCNVFNAISTKAVMRSSSVRSLALVLVFTPFFLAMVISNDVTLLTVVPLSITVLHLIHRDDLMPVILVLQTLMANLGSFMTPMGNPHNLYIFQNFGLDVADVPATMVLTSAIGVLVVAASVLTLKNGPVAVAHRDEGVTDRRFVLLMVLVFIVTLASVIRIVPKPAAFAFTILAIVLTKPKTLTKVDYSLLLTFVTLFIFTGNLAKIDVFTEMFTGLMEWNPIAASAMASQFTSNLPATLMLSSYTDDWAGLMIGTNIGGFGTPIASMASLITLKQYFKTEGADRKRYLAVFLSLNFLLLTSLIVINVAWKY